MNVQPVTERINKQILGVEELISVDKGIAQSLLVPQSISCVTLIKSCNLFLGVSFNSLISCTQ